MPDREKVIEGLECCQIGAIGCQTDCPYSLEDSCKIKLHRDAIALMKELEGQKPTKHASALMADHHYYACPKCGCMVDYLVWKCYACNQRLNWD